jgi:hypothetical protein
VAPGHAKPLRDEGERGGVGVSIGGEPSVVELSAGERPKYYDEAGDGGAAYRVKQRVGEWRRRLAAEGAVPFCLAVERLAVRGEHGLPVGAKLCSAVGGDGDAALGEGLVVGSAGFVEKQDVHAGCPWVAELRCCERFRRRLPTSP